MKHKAWLGLAPFVISVPFGLAHCSGSDSGSVGNDGGPPGAVMNPDATDVGADGSVPPGSDDASPAGDDGGNQPPAPPVDGGVVDSGHPPIPVPDGGAPSDPGSVECGGAACSVSTSYCCSQATDAGRKETCVAPNVGCDGVKLGCNEASDCAGGTVCCQAIVGIAAQGSTSCSATNTCGGGSFQTCRTDAECNPDSDAGAMHRCIPQTCTNPATKAVLKVQACAVRGMGGVPGPLAYCTAD